MQPEILAKAPRCGARARTRDGAPCRSPAVRGSARCRMHGGKGSGAPRGNRNAWKHGAFTAEMKDIARYLRLTSLIVKHANASIWAAQYAPLPSLLRRNDELRERSGKAPPVPSPLSGPTPIDLGRQPLTPGNSGEMGERLVALSPLPHAGGGSGAHATSVTFGSPDTSRNSASISSAETSATPIRWSFRTFRLEGSGRACCKVRLS